ncbi:MAG: tRNA (N6-isopentenyl adenosine(37)-C2)-methylthiotransferase MiaB [Eubacteriales bacterium]|nr:tRNA (N6-isopentenyl adenosine(37)-C2)-methylthiotransferase MiaB [Eubacteriales bacterium]
MQENIYAEEYSEIIKNITASGKKYYIFTIGCQLNENDSEKIAGILSALGCIKSESAERSDIIIYNTCAVRENAEKKVFGHLGKLKKLKEDNPKLILGLCGCMMNQPASVEKVRNKYKHVDIIFGTQNIHLLPEILFKHISENKRVFDVQNTQEIIREGLPVIHEDDLKAWVTVIYGCNNYCTYCIVPYVRGKERSRKTQDILKEIRELSDKGYKEITLLGQNVNSYGKDLEEHTDFAELLYNINEIQGIERIRFMTSHPKDISEKLISVIKDCRKVCKHLHLPLQSGSTKVLSAMNRHYTGEQYLDITDRVRTKIPDISLTTDIIVGFPGETDRDFADTLAIMKSVRFDSAFTFKYSKRTGTPAARMQEQIPSEIIDRRFLELLEVQNKISREKNEEMIGSVVEVLVEGISKKNPLYLTGRSEGNKVVNFPGDTGFRGRILPVKINRVQTWSLEGNLIKTGERSN